MIGLIGQFILSGLLWFVGLRYVRPYLWAPGEASATARAVRVTIGAVALSTLVLGGWGWYNRRRYGSLRRRRMPSDMTAADLAQALSVPVKTIEEWQRARWRECADVAGPTQPNPGSPVTPPNRLPHP